VEVWKLVEVPGGISARAPQMALLKSSQLMGKPIGGREHLLLAALRATEVADVFVGSIHHHGYLWCLLVALRQAFYHLTTEPFELVRARNPAPLVVLSGALYSF